jgi:hypothetical protein
MQHDPSASDGAERPSEAVGRAARLLEQMHRVVSHDLPNQMVALQSLLQLLDMEDLADLSAEAREYVRRLGTVAGKAGSLVRFIKEMTRLHSYQPRIETFCLAALMPDVRADLALALPESALEYRIEGDSCRVQGDPRLVRLALVEVLRYLAGRVPAVRLQITLAGTESTRGVELRGSVRAAHEAAGTMPLVLPGDADESCELVLARAWLAIGGGTLTRPATAESDWQLTITLAREAPDV